MVEQIRLGRPMKSPHEVLRGIDIFMANGIADIIQADESGMLFPSCLSGGFMPRHFPSLSALRAFESTARHLSFTRASRELHLTQTAISHQIKELERLLNTKLFDRRQGKIALTEGGRDYLAAIRPALASIATASDRVSNRRGHRLQVNCLAAFAVRCLIPALPEFRAQHPEVEIRVSPMDGKDRPQEYDFDICIGYGSNSDPGIEVSSLGVDEVFPVCSPALLALAPLSSPADLGRHTIIRSLSPIVEDDWPGWLDYVCHPQVEFENEISFNGLFLSLEAARHGMGVCMARAVLVADDLRDGRLIEPFQQRLPLEMGYHVAVRKERTDSVKVQDFLHWMLSRFPGGHEITS